MVILMLLTSVAVLAFFTRRRELAGRRPIRTRVAPVVAILGLAACLWLVLANFTLVTGASAAVSTLLALVPVVALVLGVAIGGRFSLYVEDDEPTASPVVGE
jgi:amino acid transporter